MNLDIQHTAHDVEHVTERIINATWEIPRECLEDMHRQFPSFPCSRKYCVNHPWLKTPAGKQIGTAECEKRWERRERINALLEQERKHATNATSSVRNETRAEKDLDA